MVNFKNSNSKAKSDSKEMGGCVPIVPMMMVFLLTRSYSSCIEVRALNSPINIYNVFLDDIINKLHINDEGHSVNVLQVLQNGSRTQFKFLLEIENRVSGYRRDYVAIKSEIYEDSQIERHRVTKFLQSENVRDIELLFGLDPTRGFPLNCQTLKEDFTNFFKNKEIYGELIESNIRAGRDDPQEVDFFSRPKEDKGIIALLESENVDLEKEIINLKQELDFLLMNKNSLIEEELAILKLKLEEENRLLIQDKDLTIESLKKLLQKRKDSQEQAKQVYDAQVQKEKERGEQELAELKKLHQDSLKELVKEHELEIKRMRKERETVSKEVDEAKNLIDELTKDIIAFKIKEKKKEEKKEEVEQANKRLKQNLEAMNEQNKSLKEQLKRYKEDGKGENRLEMEYLKEVLAVEQEKLDKSQSSSTHEEPLVSNEEQLIKKIEKLIEEKESSDQPVRTEEKIYLSSLPKNYYNNLIEFLNKLGDISDSEPIDINTLNMEEIKLLELQMLAEKEKAIKQTRSANQQKIASTLEEPSDNPFVLEEPDNPFQLIN